MRNFRVAIALAASLLCWARELGAISPATAPSGETAPTTMSATSAAAPGDGVLASVQVEFRAPNRALLSVVPGLYQSTPPVEREAAWMDWHPGDGRLRVTYDSASDRLEAVLEDAAGSTAVACADAVTRGFGRLDPLQFAPRVMGLLVETSNRGASGAIALIETEIASSRAPRQLQDVGAGGRAVSQLFHAERGLSSGFSFAGTIRLVDARPMAMAPLTVEVRLLADLAGAGEDESQREAPESDIGIYTNSTPTTILPTGAGSPYPSQITVDPGYLTGVLTSVVVGFDNLDHTYPGEMAALLVGPSGSNVELMRLACGSFDLLDADLTFDDTAVLQMPNGAPCFPGSWKPTRYGPIAHFPPPAPPALYGLVLADFLGQSPVGVWSLYVASQEIDGFIDLGRIDGWSLTLTTTIQIPGSGTFGNAAPYPSAFAVSGFAPNQRVKGCAVYIFGVSHSYLADLHLLLASPSGQTAYLLGDACSNTNAVGLDWIFGDDPAVGFLPGSSCGNGVYRPTVLGTQAFPAPAPSAPYGRSLAGVSGSEPNGLWSLYALDDANGDVGEIRDWSLACSTEAFWVFGDGFETGDLLLWSDDAQ